MLPLSESNLCLCFKFQNTNTFVLFQNTNTSAVSQQAQSVSVTSTVTKSGRKEEAGPGNRRASAPVTLRVIEFLRLIFSCPENRYLSAKKITGIFSSKLSSKHKLAGQSPSLHKMSKKIVFFEEPQHSAGPVVFGEPRIQSCQNFEINLEHITILTIRIHINSRNTSVLRFYSMDSSCSERAAYTGWIPPQNLPFSKFLVVAQRARSACPNSQEKSLGIDSALVVCD